MKKLKKTEGKMKSIDALIALYTTTHWSDDVYIIERNEDGIVPGVVLWMSDFDYIRLVLLANGSRVSVHEVEENTRRYRERREHPEGTERFKYIHVS